MIRPLARTARWTAAARAMESRRADRLFDDPFAAALAGEDGVAMWERMERHAQTTNATENPFLAIRTRFFDDSLSAAVAQGARQVVLLGAGLDARAYRMDRLSATRLFELDDPGLLEEKERVLASRRARPLCDLRTVGVDLAVDWVQSLITAGFDPRVDCVFVIEGLLAYLDESSVRRLIAGTKPIASAGSWLLADLPGQGFFDSAWTKPYLAALAREGVPWQFGTDDPEGLFATYGWAARAVRPGDFGANFGRWPYPLAARGAPGVPSSYFVTASRVED